ncbi:hypothetical protein MRB53_014885 [Persea americana]|uniref:Uncharacterized protein n=1 Tax=Persea americana TaxID=3435 RepID=A0ACC2KC14_PERAE|nr:hypothetical protein MRB53_014885 [Persea americana]
MDLFNSLLNLVVPPASLVMLAFAWSSLSFFHVCQWVYQSLYSEDMDDRVVLITGASSGIGEGNIYPTFVSFPYLGQSNGRIVVNASVSSWLPMPRMSIYAVPISEGYVEEFARSIVSGACRGDAYVKFPSWYDIFYFTGFLLLMSLIGRFTFSFQL